MRELKRGVLILFTIFAALSSLIFVVRHFKSNGDVLLSLFELPENMPYLYCEFNGYPEITGSNGRSVLFIFRQNEKMHRITGTAVNNEWYFRAYTSGAQQVVDRVIQMHARKTRIIPNPENRNVEGRIIACDGGLFSKVTHSPNTTVYLKAELSKFNDDEYIMNFDIQNIDSLVPAAWLNDFAPIKIKDFPSVKGIAYAHLALNITLVELIPQFQAFINKNVKNRTIASSLRSMRGELYAAIGSGNALWDGISIPALLLRFHLKNDVMKHNLFSFIHDMFDDKYELEGSDNEYYSFAPLSLWLCRSDEYLETGIIDKRSISKSGSSTLPKPPAEALLWASFSPCYLAEAINSFVTQIKPDLNFEEALDMLAGIDNCTITLHSIKSGEISWKIRKMRNTEGEMRN